MSATPTAALDRELDDALGAARDVVTPLGTLRVRESGPAGAEPLLFVHGALVDGALWRRVAPALAAAGHRCIVPDLPLGSHAIPMPASTPLDPPGIAGLLAALLDALGVPRATVVGNDTGGAMSQVFVARHPDRVARLVLTNCDAFEQFPPAVIKPLFWSLRTAPGARIALAPTRWDPIRRSPIAFGMLTHGPIPAPVTGRWMEASRRPAIRRDLVRFARGVNKRHTLEAAGHFGAYEGPVLIAWGADDVVFRPALGARLAAAFPNGRHVSIPGARTFVMEDRPDALAAEIAAFLAEDARSGEGAASAA